MEEEDVVVRLKALLERDDAWSFSDQVRDAIEEIERLREIEKHCKDNHWG